jgi:hypothetical protein
MGRVSERHAGVTILGWLAPKALNIIDRLEDVPLWDGMNNSRHSSLSLLQLPPVFRETHLELLHRKTGISLGTLLEAARDLEADVVARSE